jgi:alpha-N-arabinofuranosidase
MLRTRPRLPVLGVLAAIACSQSGEPPPDDPAAQFSNPVIAGFAPDPSVVRVGADFYLVNSTFEYFPGIPVYHSTDLVNWELISYALDRPSQVDLDSVSSGAGIHASTIRHHGDTYYVITTNNLNGSLINFVVTATDPRGPWSEPYVLEDAPGIDPSLFFDDDGTVWYVGNHDPPDPSFPGEMEIWLQELDLEGMALVGERHFLWRGCCQGTWAEGPHIYKRDGYYYLLISEGGTAYEHALSVAISPTITGPYENNPRNPILTHRQLSYDHPITGVGHADFVELKDGRWYAVALGWRLIDGEHGILGRETFLVPLTWETEPYWWKEPKLTFPVVSPETGKVELRYPMPFPGAEQSEVAGFDDDFGGEELKLEWNFRRTPPAEPFHSLTEEPGSLRLFLQPGRIEELARYSFMGIRQRDFQFETVTRMAFTPASTDEEAGVVVIQNDRSAYALTLTRAADGGSRVSLYHTADGKITPIAESGLVGDTIHFKITGDYLDYGFHYSTDGTKWTVLSEDVDGVRLSPAVIEGYNYTGAYIGLYASSNGSATQSHADFDFFSYRATADARDHWYQRQRDHETSR